MRKSNDAVLVLNAGSSSIKLSVFAESAGELALELRGEVEGLYTAPRFVAHDLAGRVVAERILPISRSPWTSPSSSTSTGIPG